MNTEGDEMVTEVMPDVTMDEFFRSNFEKIKNTAPINPSLPMGDEWRDEDCWDDLYEELEG